MLRRSTAATAAFILAAVSLIVASPAVADPGVPVLSGAVPAWAATAPVRVYEGPQPRGGYEGWLIEQAAAGDTDAGAALAARFLGLSLAAGVYGDAAYQAELAGRDLATDVMVNADFAAFLADAASSPFASALAVGWSSTASADAALTAMSDAYVTAGDPAALWNQWLSVQAAYDAAMYLDGASLTTWTQGAYTSATGWWGQFPQWGEAPFDPSLTAAVSQATERFESVPAATTTSGGITTDYGMRYRISDAHEPTPLAGAARVYWPAVAQGADLTIELDVALPAFSFAGGAYFIDGAAVGSTATVAPGTISIAGTSVTLHVTDVDALRTQPAGMGVYALLADGSQAQFGLSFYTGASGTDPVADDLTVEVRHGESATVTETDLIERAAWDSAAPLNVEVSDIDAAIMTDPGVGFTFTASEEMPVGATADMVYAVGFDAAAPDRRYASQLATLRFVVVDEPTAHPAELAATGVAVLPLGVVALVALLAGGLAGGLAVARRPRTS